MNRQEELITVLNVMSFFMGNCVPWYKLSTAFTALLMLMHGTGHGFMTR